MIRKIFGGLLLALSAFIVIGAISNGTLLQDHGSAAVNLGTIVGTLLPVIVNILAGIFLFAFDNIYKKSYAEGFKARKHQCSKIVLFLCIYAAFIFIASMGIRISRLEDFLVAYLVAIIPYFIPLLLFAAMLGFYATPYWACKKHFKLNDAQADAYLSDSASFQAYSQGNTILANADVLFLTQTYCVIPLEQLTAVKFINIIIEQDVEFTLANGKKFAITANKKQYDSIAAALAAYKQAHGQS